MEPASTPPAGAPDPAPQDSLVQCQVTGKWVSPEEIVEVNGMRVCAEGKQVLLQRLKTGEGMPGTLERPTVLRRFGCLFLDGLIIGVPTGLINAGVLAALRGSADDVARMAGVSSLLLTLAGLLYVALLHGFKGQTVGKMTGRIKVVNLDGSPISMATAFWRALCYQGLALVGPLLMIFLGGGEGVIGQGIATGLYGLWTLTSILLALVDSQMQRALHDRLAGTRVVMVQ